MFENLSNKLKSSFNKILGRGFLSEKNLEEVTKELKEALLDADVNIKVVDTLIENIKMKSIGKEILSGINASQQFIKVISDEIINLLGSKAYNIHSSSYPNIIMLLGLQGVGKTTLAAKLANYLKKDSKKVLLASLDVQRPAAIEQLKILANKNNIDFFENVSLNVTERAESLLQITRNYKYVIIDTAGRLQTDNFLIEELKNLKNLIKPHEVILVLDSMLGQESLNVSTSFNEKIGIDSVVITKLDGDSRGGVALSVKHTIDKPIKFISTGEKTEDLEKFYPERIASRILGQGDIVSLVEKAQSVIDEKKNKEIEDKIKKNKFDFSDFLFQLEALSKMGPISKLIKLIPGAPKIDQTDFAEKQLIKTKALIYSMTLKERSNPKILDSSRKNRISKGAGLNVADINRLLEQFNQLQKVFTMFKGKF